MLPLQHAQQLHQGLGVKPASDLDATAARQCHRQTTAPQRRRVGVSHLYRQPAPSPYGLALRLPLPIAGQRGQTQPVLPAELNTAQPAAFVLARHLLGFRASPPAPDLYHLRLIVHPSTESPTAEFGQMGWSNAYGGKELPENLHLIGRSQKSRAPFLLADEMRTSTSPTLASRRSELREDSLLHGPSLVT